MNFFASLTQYCCCGMGNYPEADYQAISHPIDGPQRPSSTWLPKSEEAPPPAADEKILGIARAAFDENFLAVSA